MKARAFHLVSPGRLEIRQGGGCLAIFGLPFFGAGIFVILTVLGIVPMSNPEETPGFAWIALPLLGAVFTAVGGAMVFGRSWTTIDAAHRTLDRQWGLLVPMHTTSHRLEDYTAVVVAFEAGDSDSADRFPVTLKPKAGARLPIYSSTEYADARSCAVEVARLLHLDVEDATTDHAVRVRAAHGDLSLRERLRLESREEQAAVRPPDARSDVHPEGGRLRISIPLPRTHPVAAAAGFIPVVIVLVYLGPFRQFFQDTKTPDPVAWAFLGFLTIGFVLLPTAIALHSFLRSRRGATLVSVSPDGIVVEDRGAWKTRTTANHPAQEILDVDFSTTQSATTSARQAAQEAVASSRSASGTTVIGPRTERWLVALSRFAKGRGITVKTRGGLTTFGQGLDDDEIRYLHALVRRALAGDT